MSEEEIIDNYLNVEQQQPIQLATQEAYWQHYRIQAAIHIAAGIATRGITYCKDVAEIAVKQADALIEELKKGGEQ